MEKLTELLNNISDSYYDFVVSVLNYAKRNNKNTEAMIAFIENNPNALSSDVLEYMLSRDDYFDHAQRIAGVSTRIQERA